MALNFYNWNFADWATKATSSEQLSQLGKHIEEVSQAAGDVQNRGNRARLLDSLVNKLFDARKDLIASGATVTDPTGGSPTIANLARRFGVRRFVRGGGS